MYRGKEIVDKIERIDLHDVDTYVFDYGGVVSFHYCQPWQGNIARILNVSPEFADNLLSETSLQGKSYREGKITRDEFWNEVAKLADVKDVSYSELEENWARSYQIDKRMLGLIERLRNERGFKVGLITNADSYRQQHIEKEYHLSQTVDFIMSSFQHAVTKPNPEAYRIALSLAGRTQTPSKVLYIDDKEKNIVPCLSIGMKGYVFTTYEDFTQALYAQNILQRTHLS